MKPGPIPLKADTSIRPIKRVRYVYGSTSYGTIAKTSWAIEALIRELEALKQGVSEI